MGFQACTTPPGYGDTGPERSSTVRKTQRSNRAISLHPEPPHVSAESDDRANAETVASVHNVQWDHLCDGLCETVVVDSTNRSLPSWIVYQEI